MFTNSWLVERILAEEKANFHTLLSLYWLRARKLRIAEELMKCTLSEFFSPIRRLVMGNELLIELIGNTGRIEASSIIKEE
jgi:hypothetical protein